MTNTTHQITPEDFDPASGTTLRAERVHSPRVISCRWEGRAVVLKTYEHCSFFYRHVVGRMAMAREWWVLNKLSGSGHAPEPVARLSPWSVVMSQVSGQSLEHLNPDQRVTDELLSEAENLLRTLAASGIVHGDIGHDFWSDMGREANLIWTHDHRLVAIDFAGSVPLRMPWPLKAVSEALHHHDRLVLTKLLYHFGRETHPEHPAWKEPSRWPIQRWDLLRFLGKL